MTPDQSMAADFLGQPRHAEGFLGRYTFSGIPWYAGRFQRYCFFSFALMWTDLEDPSPLTLEYLEGGKARNFWEIFHLTTRNITPPHMFFGLPKEVGGGSSGALNSTRTWRDHDKPEIFSWNIPGESFFGTSAEITFQHRNRRILNFLPKTNKIADHFQFCRNGVFMGCAYLCRRLCKDGSRSEIPALRHASSRHVAQKITNQNLIYKNTLTEKNEKTLDVLPGFVWSPRKSPSFGFFHKGISVWTPLICQKSRKWGSKVLDEVEIELLPPSKSHVPCIGG